MAKKNTKSEEKVVDLVGPFKRAETKRVFSKLREDAGALDATTTFLGGIYNIAQGVGFKLAHVDGIAAQYYAVKLEAWRAKNKLASKDDAPEERRDAKTAIKRVVEASVMCAPDFWDALVACTENPETIGKACIEAKAHFKAKGTAPNANQVASIVRKINDDKRNGGTKNKNKSARPDKATAHIASMLKRVKKLSAKKFAEVCGDQLAMIKRALDVMQKRAVKAEAVKDK